MAAKLEFEGGKLTKVSGMRPEYMDGHQLIMLTRELACEVEALRHELAEVVGTTHEYLAMPCSSLRARMRASVDKASLKLT